MLSLKPASVALGDAYLLTVFYLLFHEIFWRRKKTHFLLLELGVRIVYSDQLVILGTL